MAEHDMTDPDTPAEELERAIRAAPTRKVIGERTWRRYLRDIAMTLGFLFVIASTIGIQLDAREDDRARDEQLVKLEEQGAAIQELVEFAAGVSSPAAKAETAGMLNEVLTIADCNTRRAISDGFKEAGWIVRDLNCPDGAPDAIEAPDTTGGG